MDYAAIHDGLMALGTVIGPWFIALVVVLVLWGIIQGFRYPNRTSGWKGRLLPAELKSLRACKAESPEIQAILVREANKTEITYELEPWFTYRYIFWGPKNPRRKVTEKIMALNDPNYGGFKQDPVFRS